MLFWIACLLVPLIGGLQRYAVAYGYEGVSKSEAWAQARRVAVILAAFYALFAAAKMFE